MTAAADIVLGPAQRAFADHLVARGFRPTAPLRTGRLGEDEAGITGAADLVRHS